MFPWDMTSNEQQHACTHLLLNQVFVVVKYLVYCNLLGQGGPVRFVVCQLTVGLTRKVRRIFQGSYITSVSDQPFRGHRKLGGRGRMHPPLF